jgi:hypothetical protein
MTNCNGKSPVFGGEDDNANDEMQHHRSGYVGAGE